METVRKVYDSDLAEGVEMRGPEHTVRLALEEIGLSQHEIALYRTALTLGPRPASTLAKSIRVQRTRVYDLLSSLEARGLMEMVERGKIRYYTATSPDRLLSLLRDRKEYVENQLHDLEHALPSLFANSNALSSTIESRTVRGVRNLRETLDELLMENGSAIVSIGDLELGLRNTVGTTRWAQQFREKRISREISLRICVQGPPDFYQETALLRETLSSPDIPSGSLVLATHDTVVFLELSDALQATMFQSKIFCAVLHGMYSSWLGAVQRIS